MAWCQCWGSGSASVWKAGPRSASKSKGWIRIRIKFKIQELWRLKMEPWRVCLPMVAGLHHFNEEHGSRIRIRKEKVRFRIRVKGKRQISIHIYNSVQCSVSTASDRGVLVWAMKTPIENLCFQFCLIAELSSTVYLGGLETTGSREQLGLSKFTTNNNKKYRTL